LTELQNIMRLIIFNDSFGFNQWKFIRKIKDIYCTFAALFKIKRLYY